MADNIVGARSRLLERENELRQLEEARQAAAAGQGRLLFIQGEAGVGKSSLVRCFAEAASPGAVLVGTCDPLDTPCPLGPLLDIAPGLGPDFAGRIAAAASGADLFAAFSDCLAAASPPIILVFEDIHWADQASLDLLRFPGRRIERLSALVIATLRHGGSGLDQPVTALLGDLATTPGVGRLRLSPLSRSATAELAAGTTIDANDLYECTGGNPFLATGRWSGIEAAALGLLERRDLAAVPRLTALFTLGRLKARRGESDGRTYLDRALEVTRQHRRVAAVTPVWPVIAEAAWLSGNRDAALETVRRAEADETSAWSPWALGDLALWRYLASGHSRSEKERPVAEPYALILAGHGEAAAELWQQRGCPYEAAVA